MNKYGTNELSGLPTAEELRSRLAAGESSGIRETLKLLFDPSSFVETEAYAKRAFSDFLDTEAADELEGVITGYGAIDGKLVFAFAEDSARMGGVIDERHAKKITDLYAMAMKNAAPVIGIFDSNGTDIFTGTAGLAAYGKIAASVNRASGQVPQIAFVAGKCIGLSAAIASMFDFVVKANDATLYVTSPDLIGCEGASDVILSYQGDGAQCAGFVRALVSFLPMDAASGIVSGVPTDNLNRMLGDVDMNGDGLTAIATVADNGVVYEIASGFADGACCAFATVAGINCGFVATSFGKNEGRLNASSARKISKFVSFCDAFSIPVVTLVDSLGLTLDKDNEVSFFAPELAKLASAYASASCPKVTVILGHAIGASFVLLGSKSLGADLVYALDTAEIGALPAESGVSFAWDKFITEDKNKNTLIEEWKASVASPEYAAASGEIDDIISIRELRARICSAVLMLAGKGTALAPSHKILPL